MGDLNSFSQDLKVRYALEIDEKAVDDVIYVFFYVVFSCCSGFS